MSAIFENVENEKLILPLHQQLQSFIIFQQYDNLSGMYAKCDNFVLKVKLNYLSMSPNILLKFGTMD